MSKVSTSSDKPQESGGYGYTYGGGSGYGGYGYGYGGDEQGGGAAVQRTLRDYLLILRERIWYVVVVFLVVFSSALVYTLSDTKIYRADASVQIFRSGPAVMNVKQVVDSDIRSAEDLNTELQVINSGQIVERVTRQVMADPELLRQFIAPFPGAAPDAGTVAGILGGNRRASLQRLTLFVLIGFQHPDRFVAAKVANLFAQAYIDNNMSLRTAVASSAVINLKETIAAQKKLVDDLANSLQAYKESKNAVSLDGRKDVVNEALRTVSSSATAAQQALNVAQTRIDQIKERRANGGDLTELPFIASQVGGLKSAIAAKKIEIAALEKRYRDKWPAMVRARNELAATEQELAKAIADACKLVEADYQSAFANYQQLRAELEKKKEDSLELDRLAVDYAAKEREFKTQEALLMSLTARQSETSVSNNISMPNARIVDFATAPPESRPISPNVSLNIGLGLAGGLGLGLAFAFFVAFVDDRVKSSFDIEGVVGLPLMGVIPQIKRMDQADKAQIVANNADRQVAEAFLTLHSSLRLKDDSKNARCILVTSTIPGEGKSFTTTNLALTFAAHGEKVVIVDCDLRKPNVHKSFRVENLKGVIDVAAGKATLNDVIVPNVHPNLDILPAGGRAKNPTQVLNSKGFELMISDLRKRYDRVFIDTPPLAAVSDAMIILPLVDGSLFTIFFNKVRRKAAQFSAKRLQESNVPVFGAVLNGLNLAVSGYYYAQYYDKSYKDYYVVMSKEEGGDSDER